MATFLFDKTVFGPVKSRRLGISLGINLLPNDRKICSFDCIYCECGLNVKGGEKQPLPTRVEVKHLLELKLIEMTNDNLQPDVITFAGNGEPTLHPHFEGVIDDTIELRNRFCPNARIAVLSNSTRIGNASVKSALLKVDDNILKLDSGIESTIRLLDRPVGHFSLEKLMADLQSFNGQLIIQTMFVRGSVDGTLIDNTSDADVESWLVCLQDIKPKRVMIYTIERDTPFDGLKKVSIEDLENIAQRARLLGFDVQVSG
jgi:wyosine [tRNA(Phe)-imidazoG37] synthetase (radical SAM superfamily)